MAIAALRAILDAVVPRRCAACGDPSPADLCPGCVDVLSGAPAPQRRPCDVIAVTAAWPHAGAARRVLLAGKYSGRHRAYRLLAVIAAERLAPGLILGGPIAAVVPVPTAGMRRRRRGVDTGLVAAAALAELVPGAGPLLPHLHRDGFGPSHVGRGGVERRLRPPQFTWASAVAPPRGRVLLVDDVCTTGTTLAAASAALQRAGAHRIEAVAITASLSTPARTGNRIAS